jgi:hypothetical protein
MNKPIPHDPLKALLAAPSAGHSLPIADLRPADVEMARVLKTAPLRMSSDPSNGAIAHWRHGALHDVVEPMTHHVVMTYPTGVQRLERRTGKSVATGTARSGVVTIIPAGSSARYSRRCRCHPALSSAHNARTRCPRSRRARSRRPSGADGASGRRHIWIADERGGCAGRQCGPGCPVQTATDGSRGHTPPC